MSGFYSNYLLVIESLEKESADFSKDLFDNILAPDSKNNMLNTSYKVVKNKNELFNLLEKVNSICKVEDIFPIIHFEVHGSNDGLELLEDFVSWKEICNSLLNINISCKNNLFISVAACKGSSGLILLAKDFKRAPFWGIIGPNRDITNEELKLDMAIFYSEVLDSFDIGKGIKLLFEFREKQKIPYTIETCEFMFELLIEKWKNKLVKDNFLETDYQLNAIKKTINQRGGKYFMIDLYPENAKRFNLSRFHKIVDRN